MNEQPRPEELEKALHQPSADDDAAQRVVAQLGLAATPVAPPPGSRERLLARAAALAAPPPDKPQAGRPARPRTGGRTLLRPWIGLAVAAALVGCVILAGQAARAEQAARTAQLDLAARLQAEQLSNAALRGELAALREEAERNKDLLAILRSSQVESFVLRPAENGRPGYARILWDQQNRRWHLRAVELPTPAVGRTYELWFITPDQRKIAAGSFDVDAHGTGDLLIDLPPDLGEVALAAITDEPRGGVTQPTGTIHLAGKTP